MKVQRFITLLVCLTAISVWAETNASESYTFGLKPGDFYQKPQGFLSQLIDPSKFSMSQSYSVSVMSGSGKTFNQGLYLNTMEYKFSDPLVAKVSIGYMHQPFGGPQLNQNSNGQVFLQQARLQYMPFRNTMITLDFQQVPGPYFWRY